MKNQQFSRSISASVINSDDLKIADRLPPDRPDRAIDETLVAETGDEDGKERMP